MASVDAFRPHHLSEFSPAVEQVLLSMKAQWPFVTAVRLSRNQFGLKYPTIHPRYFFRLVALVALVVVVGLVGLLVIV